MLSLINVSLSEMENVFECLRLAELEAAKQVRHYFDERNDEIYRYFYEEAVCHRDNLIDAKHYVEIILREAKDNSILEED